MKYLLRARRYRYFSIYAVADRSNYRIYTHRSESACVDEKTVVKNRKKSTRISRLV